LVFLEQAQNQLAVRLIQTEKEKVQLRMEAHKARTQPVTCNPQPSTSNSNQQPSTRNP
jgi:hypothetical protein